MKTGRVVIFLLAFIPSLIRLLAQSADTSARLQPKPEPTPLVTPGIVFPILEDRLFVLLVGVILVGGTVLLLNMKRKKVDTAASQDP